MKKWLLTNNQRIFSRTSQSQVTKFSSSIFKRTKKDQRFQKSQSRTYKHFKILFNPLTLLALIKEFLRLKKSNARRPQQFRNRFKFKSLMLILMNRNLQKLMRKKASTLIKRKNKLQRQCNSSLRLKKRAIKVAHLKMIQMSKSRKRFFNQQKWILQTKANTKESNQQFKSQKKTLISLLTCLLEWILRSIWTAVIMSVKTIIRLAINNRCNNSCRSRTSIFMNKAFDNNLCSNKISITVKLISISKPTVKITKCILSKRIRWD